MPIPAREALRKVLVLAWMALPVFARPLPSAVWSYRAFTGGPERAAFFAFAARNGIGSLYLGAGDSGPVPGDFLREAQARGISVSLVLGQAWWIDPARRPEALGAVREAAAFARARGLAGLHLDIEPHVLPQWEGDWARLAGQYLDFLEAARAELDGLSLQVDIPVWWRGRDVSRGPRTQPLSAWVMEIADLTVLMDYRTTPRSILEGAAQDLAMAERRGQRVVLGLAAHCSADPDNGRTSFCAKGARALRRSMAEVDRRLRGNRAYAGMAVFTYEDWAALPQRRRKAASAAP